MPLDDDWRSRSSRSGPVTQQQAAAANAAQVPWNVQLDQGKTAESAAEQTQLQRHEALSVPLFAPSMQTVAALEPWIERPRPCGRHQLLPRTRSPSHDLSQQHPLEVSLEWACRCDGHDVIDAVEDVGADVPARYSSAGDFEEFESDVADSRNVAARMAQLWSSVGQAKHAADILCEPPQQPLERVSACDQHRSLPAQNISAVDDNNTFFSDEEEDEERHEETVIEHGGMELQSITRFGSYSTGDIRSSRQLVGQRDVEEWENDIGSDGGHQSEGSGNYSEDTASESSGLQLEQDDDVSNRAINVLKARAITTAMLENLIRLSFCEDITRAALEAGILEVDHYDSDCELAYVDIFMSLVKMVYDAHIHVLGEGNDVEQHCTSHNWNCGDCVQSNITDANVPSSFEQHLLPPFKWPVFDMAQFEFEDARPGTCFYSVCVLTNLPIVSMDRTEELMEVLSCYLFCRISDPIQVVIPSASDTGRTKGHAFLEFDSLDIAQKCALAVDGLTWGRGYFGRIRGKLFRQHQIKSSVAWDWLASVTNNGRTSTPCSVSSVPGDGSLPDAATLPPPMSEYHDSSKAERFRPGLGVALQQTSLCDSHEDDSETGTAGISREQYRPSRHNVAMQLGWDDDVLDGEYLIQQRREGGEGDDENHESFDSNSMLEFQVPDEEKLTDHFCRQELVRIHPPSPNSLSLSHVEDASSSVTSSASNGARKSCADCGMAMESWDVDEGNNVANKPCRRCCEDRMLHYCEMQEQIASAHHRIVQLSHNNQKLHLLIDRVERDRDSLLHENSVLQTQLYGYEDHEQHHDSLMKELVLLQQRVTQQEHSFRMRTLDPLEQFKAACTISNAASGFSYGVRAALSNITSVSLANCKIEELKEWEQQLECTLSLVRSIKEGRALEMQKKLDRQVEEQNELKLCVICLSNEKSILCLPCRHLCLCTTCSQRQEVTKCPICRVKIKERLAVYS